MSICMCLPLLTCREPAGWGARARSRSRKTPPRGRCFPRWRCGWTEKCRNRDKPRHLNVRSSIFAQHVHISESYFVCRFYSLSVKILHAVAAAAPRSNLNMSCSVMSVGLQLQTRWEQTIKRPTVNKEDIKYVKSMSGSYKTKDLEGDYRNIKLPWSRMRSQGRL